MFNKSGLTAYVLVYVDDIIITGNSSPGIHQIIAALSARFALKDLGTLNYFLGIEVMHNSSGMYLSQQKYVLDLLDDLNMADCKGLPTPLSPSTDLSAATDCTEVDVKLYRRVIGKLHYLSFTRPDIAFSVNKLS